MKKILVISKNESIIDLFRWYAEECGGGIKIVNENPALPIVTVDEAVKKIKKTEFDVLVIGHKLRGFNPELINAGMEKSESGEGLNVLNNLEIKNLLTEKVIISDGQTPYNNNEVRNLYINAGVRHFINRREMSLTERFKNLMLCLNEQCDCKNLN